MDIGFTVDILTGEQLSSCWHVYMQLIYWLVRASRVGWGKESGFGVIVILASCEHHFFRVKENLA